MNHIALLQSAMIFYGYNHVKLSLDTGINSASISYILSGKRTMTVKNAIKFAQVMPMLSANKLLYAQVDYKLKK